jgi:hypothetical protein
LSFIFYASPIESLGLAFVDELRLPHRIVQFNIVIIFDFIRLLLLIGPKLAIYLPNFVFLIDTAFAIFTLSIIVNL